MRGDKARKDGASSPAKAAASAPAPRRIDADVLVVGSGAGGLATAAGCQLVATCDLAIAADTARLATSGINVGLFCSTPGVAVGRAVARKHAMDMLLTGDFLDAARAAEIGLINRAVPEALLDETVGELAAKLARKPETFGLALTYSSASATKDLAISLKLPGSGGGVLKPKAGLVNAANTAVAS